MNESETSFSPPPTKCQKLILQTLFDIGINGFYLLFMSTFYCYFNVLYIIYCLFVSLNTIHAHSIQKLFSLFSISLQPVFNQSKNIEEK